MMGVIGMVGTNRPRFRETAQDQGQSLFGHGGKTVFLLAQWQLSWWGGALLVDDCSAQGKAGSMISGTWLARALRGSLVAGALAKGPGCRLRAGGDSRGGGEWGAVGQGEACRGGRGPDGLGA